MAGPFQQGQAGVSFSGISDHHDCPSFLNNNSSSSNSSKHLLSVCLSQTVFQLAVSMLSYLEETTDIWASQVVQVAKNPPANKGDVRDMGSVPGLGRSPGGGHGNPLQYSCLENPKDRGAWRARAMGSQRVGHDWSHSEHTSICNFLWKCIKNRCSERRKDAWCSRHGMMLMAQSSW